MCGLKTKRAATHGRPSLSAKLVAGAYVAIHNMLAPRLTRRIKISARGAARYPGRVASGAQAPPVAGL